MIKIKNKEKLKEYSEIVQKLNPVLTNDFVVDVQDYIENQIVEYSQENIKREDFLEFVADRWAIEVTVQDAIKNPNYNFSLYDKERSLIDIKLLLGVNEEETEVMVTDIEVNVNQ